MDAPVDPNTAVLAVDIGGSKYMVGICDARGTILCSRSYGWRGRTADEIANQVADAVDDELSSHPDLAARVIAGGVAIPGFADPTRGIWVDSDHFPVHDLPICDLLAERADIPFFGDNDCNACVLAEALFGSGVGLRDFLYITVSSGIGGGVFLGGRLFYGERLLSGEIGLTIVEPLPRPDISGKARGRLEAYGCTRGMAQTFAELGGKIDGEGPVGGLEISQMAARGDAAALETLRREGIYLGRAIAAADALIAPERVIVGGGISLMLDRFLEVLIDELHRIRPHTATRVEATPLGYEGAFLGAAACALRGISGGARTLAGAGGGSILTVGCEMGHTFATLSCAGREELTASGAGDLGGYLVADGIDDRGMSLDGILTAGDELYGAALGRALAFACTLLDPATVHLTGTLAAARPRLEDALLEVFWRDSFWARDKIPYRFIWS